MKLKIREKEEINEGEGENGEEEEWGEHEGYEKEKWREVNLGNMQERSAGCIDDLSSGVERDDVLVGFTRIKR